MKKLPSLALVFCAACADLPSNPLTSLPLDTALSSRAQTTTFRLVIPIGFDAWACGETVSLQGELVMVQHINSNDQGTHAKVLFLQKLVGYGRTSGSRYLGIGVDNATGSTSTDAAEPYNEVFTFRLVGNGVLMLVTARIHVTQNPNGDVTAEFIRTAIDCNVK